MFRKLGVLCCVVLLAGCASKVASTRTPKPLKMLSVEGYHLPIYDFEAFKPVLDFPKAGRVKVINFWATWCAPCVKELPAFEKLYAAYHKKGVEVMLVSLDFPDQIEERLIPYIKEKKLRSKVLYLDDAHGNTWIPQVSEDWSGAIPASLIITNEEYMFYEQSFSYRELENELLSLQPNLKE